MSLVYKLAKWWAVDDSRQLPPNVDVIALVSIVSTPKRLSRGATSTTTKALGFLERYEKLPFVVFGSFAGNTDGINIEERLKWAIFRANSMYVGKVWTTITECLAYKKACPEAKSVIFVTEEAHSRRAKIVWNCLWPEAKIYIVSVPLEETIDPESCMTTYHSPWKALILQAGPTPFYKVASWFGPSVLKLLGNIHQPTI